MEQSTEYPNTSGYDPEDYDFNRFDDIHNLMNDPSLKKSASHCNMIEKKLADCLKKAVLDGVQ